MLMIETRITKVPPTAPAMIGILSFFDREDSTGTMGTLELEGAGAEMEGEASTFGEDEVPNGSLGDGAGEVIVPNGSLGDGAGEVVILGGGGMVTSGAGVAGFGDGLLCISRL